LFSYLSLIHKISYRLPRRRQRFRDRVSAAFRAVLFKPTEPSYEPLSAPLVVDPLDRDF